MRRYGRDWVAGRSAQLALALVLAMAATGATAQQPPPLTRIAFGSCANQERPQPIWRAVLAYRPELFLFIGDNVYGDIRDGKTVPEDESMESLRHAYAATARVPGYMAVKNEIPHLATWDDHDYGANDGGGDFRHKQEAKRQFLDFWNVPAGDPRRNRDGVHHAQTFGPAGQRVQVILLDTRFFRSPLKPTDQQGAPGKERYVPDDNPAKTMLGAAQWEWLAEQLRQPAELRLIVSSIQVLTEGHGWERWGNLPRERQRLVDLIRESGAEGVIILSGDRHIGAIYRQADAVPYPLVEITSSGLNQTFPSNREPGPNRLGGVFGAANFGTIDVDWWEGAVNLSLRALNGEVVRRHAVTLDELRRR